MSDSDERERSSPKRATRWQRTVLLVLLCLFVLALPGLGWLVHGNRRWESLRAQAKTIRIGMTQDEVLAIMGEPDRRVDGANGEPRGFRYAASIPLRRDPEICVGFDPVVWVVEEHPYQQIPFGSADWRKSSEVRRGFMIDDLLQRFDLIGMTRSEVIDLLGEPPEAPAAYDDAWDFVYCLGPQRGSFFRIDSDWLVLHFDEANRVKEFDIDTD